MARRILRHALEAPHSTVTVNIYWAWALEDTEACLEYFGPSADLIAAGLVTAELMKPAGTRARFDAQGRKVRIHRGPKQARVRMIAMSEGDALAMPGVTPERIAFAISESGRERERANEVSKLWIGEAYALGAAHRQARRSHLRLVVDNTRPSA